MDVFLVRSRTATPTVKLGSNKLGIRNQKSETLASAQRSPCDPFDAEIAYER
jgi:hypothetical protein